MVLVILCQTHFQRSSTQVRLSYGATYSRHSRFNQKPTQLRHGKQVWLPRNGRQTSSAKIASYGYHGIDLHSTNLLKHRLLLFPTPLIFSFLPEIHRFERDKLRFLNWQKPLSASRLCLFTLNLVPNER